jgi:hypothetical protein
MFSYQAVEVMHALDVYDEPASVLRRSLRIRFVQAAGEPILVGNGTCAICPWSLMIVVMRKTACWGKLTVDAERLPRGVHFWGPDLAVDVLVHE